MSTCPITRSGRRRSAIPEVPVEGGTGRAVVSPAASTLREEMAVSGQRLLAASGQIPMATHSVVPEGPNRRRRRTLAFAAYIRTSTDDQQSP
jgi:hypothetical protein